MSNVRPDAWSSSIPMAGAQLRNLHEEYSSSVEVLYKVGERNLSLTERDYIGLSDSSSSLAIHASDRSSLAEAYDLECKDTELRLGIGPSNGGVSSQQQRQPPPPQHDVNPLHQYVKPVGLDVAPAGEIGASSSVQNFWQVAQAFRVNGSGDQSGGEAGCYNNYPWGPGLAPGRFVIPVSKMSAVPAKRPYLEAIGGNATHATANNSGNMGGSASLNTSAADVSQLHNSTPSSTSATPAAAAAAGGGGGGGGGVYTWSTNAMQMAGGLQHMSFEQGNNMSAFGKTSLPRVFPAPPPQRFKVPPAPMSRHQPPVAATASEPLSSFKADSQNEDSGNCKTPMVGWPPMRSFHKNALHATHGSKLVNTEDVQESGSKVNTEDVQESGSKVNTEDPQESGGGEVSEQSNNSENAFYVKVKLDGVRIGRKVDLKSYHSYYSLKSALQEMFQGFVNGAKLDLLYRNNYVLTHEDEDGHWMLVGDVPWHMFIASTVKSFRIMTAADAIGLGERVSAKLKAQSQLMQTLRAN